ncbi:MAG: hypothetical protein ACFFC7_11800 [Candidatus Hermodarchaeota archaeon]
MPQFALNDFARAYSIEDVYIDQLIEQLYRFPTLRPEDWGRWEMEFSALELHGMGDPVPERLVRKISASLRRTFAILVEAVVEVSAVCWYGAVTVQSREFLLEVFRILQDHDIELPNLTPFEISSFSERGGWGDPVSAEVVNRWREAA